MAPTAVTDSSLPVAWIREPAMKPIIAALPTKRARMTVAGLEPIQLEMMSLGPLQNASAGFTYLDIRSMELKRKCRERTSEFKKKQVSWFVK